MDMELINELYEQNIPTDQHLPRKHSSPELALFINFALNVLISCLTDENSKSEGFIIGVLSPISLALVYVTAEARGREKAYAAFYAKCEFNVKDVKIYVLEMLDMMLPSENLPGFNPANPQVRAGMFVDYATAHALPKRRAANRNFILGSACSIASLMFLREVAIFSSAAICVISLFLPVACFALREEHASYYYWLKVFYGEYAAQVSNAYEAYQADKAVVRAIEVRKHMHNVSECSEELRRDD